MEKLLGKTVSQSKRDLVVDGREKQSFSTSKDMGYGGKPIRL